MIYRLIILFCIIIIQAGCSKDKTFINSNIEILGHGGAGFESFVNPLPPNSFASIIKAIDGLNADGAEVDLQMDKNLVLWLYHDQRLETSTNCEGCLGDLNTDYLNQCYYNKGINQNVFKKQKLVKLVDLIKRYLSYEPRPIIFLDINTYDKCYGISTLSDELIKIIDEFDAYSWIQISSESIKLLTQLRDKSEKLQLFIESSKIEESRKECEKYFLNGIITKNSDISKDQINEYQKLNLKVVLFAMNGYRETVEAIKKQPDQIQTDNIELLFRILDR